MGTVPPAAPQRSPQVLHELEQLAREYGGTWEFDYVAGDIQPWRAERSKAQVVVRPVAITALRAADVAQLRRATDSVEWIETRGTW